MKVKIFIDNEDVDLEHLDEFVSVCEVDTCQDCYDCEDCCRDCECDDEGVSYGELLDIFTMRILEAQGCEECIKRVLNEFADIFIEED